MNDKISGVASPEFLKIGIKVVELVDAHASVRVDEIEQSLFLASADASRYLTLLSALGLIRFNADKSAYAAGKHLFESARSFNDDFALLNDAAEEMAELNRLTGETVFIAGVFGDEAVYAGRLSGSSVSGAREIGSRVPLWQSAIGKALAANLHTDARASLIRRVDTATLTSAGFADAVAFEAHLDLIRARGFAVEVNAPEADVSVVAAPVVNSRGFSVAAIGIEGNGDQLPRMKLFELAPAVVKATRKPSARAGGAPRPLSNSPRPSPPVSPKVRVLADVRNLIGEAPVYDAANDRLYWIDMYDPTIFRLDRKSEELRSFPQNEMVTALALAPEGLFVAAQSGLWVVNAETGKRIRFLGDPEAKIPTNRFNDGKCDSRSRLWINTIDLNFARGAGALYRRDAGGEFRTMETGLNIPNGLGWSPDNKTMYLADSADRVIYAFDFDEASGEIANRRVLVRLPEDVPGAPDGLTVDRDGNLWVAVFDGWRVSCFSPQGTLIEEIIMPVPRPTSCALGGKNGETLFVTSARLRVSDETLKVAPHAGAVFEIDL